MLYHSARTDLVRRPSQVQPPRFLARHRLYCEAQSCLDANRRPATCSPSPILRIQAVTAALSRGYFGTLMLQADTTSRASSRRRLGDQIPARCPHKHAASGSDRQFHGVQSGTRAPVVPWRMLISQSMVIYPHLDQLKHSLDFSLYQPGRQRCALTAG